MNSKKKKRLGQKTISWKTDRKSGVLITLPLKTRVKCITVLLYIRVLNRCLSAPPPPSPHIRLSNARKQQNRLNFSENQTPFLDHFFDGEGTLTHTCRYKPEF